MKSNLKFGLWFAPFHPTKENPTLSITRELDLIEWIDHLGFEEVWIGEHYSGGWGIISAPDLMLAAAAERTKQIKLATGVVTLPFHNPLVVANRMTQLDHMTKGRLIFGVGSGHLPSDSYMMGIEAGKQREMMAESLEAIVHLMDTHEPLSMKTDWFTLNEARLHLRPYSGTRMEMAIASLYSPNSMKLAGKHGLSPFSLGGILPGGDLTNLSSQWEIAENEAAKYHNRMNRDDWRLIMPIHVAETSEEARKDVREGGRRWLIDYFKNTHGRPVEFDVEPGYEFDAFIDQGGAIVGSVEECIQQIECLLNVTGGFGKLIAVGQDWSSTEKVKKSFELIARYIMPHFNKSNESILDSQKWVSENREHFSEKWSKAQSQAMKS